MTQTNPKKGLIEKKTRLIWYSVNYLQSHSNCKVDTTKKRILRQNKSPAKEAHRLRANRRRRRPNGQAVHPRQSAAVPQRVRARPQHLRQWREVECQADARRERRRNRARHRHQADTPQLCEARARGECSSGLPQFGEWSCVA